MYFSFIFGFFWSLIQFLVKQGKKIFPLYFIAAMRRTFFPASKSEYVSIKVEEFTPQKKKTFWQVVSL